MTEFRDTDSRWRSVLGELRRSESIDVEEALELLDQDDAALGDREPDWYVGMARASIDADAFDEFLHKRSVLLADGRRIESPGGSDPRSLVRRIDLRSLAAALDVALKIHPAYLTDEPDAQRVAEMLVEWEVLIDECDSADGVLRVLARDHSGNTIGSVRVEGTELIPLRDAFERLSEDEQKTLGPRIGQNIELRAFEYDWDGKLRGVGLADRRLPAEGDRSRNGQLRPCRGRNSRHLLARR